MVNFLLENGAEVNTSNIRGKTALYFAVEIENKSPNSSFELSKQLISS